MAVTIVLLFISGGEISAASFRQQIATTYTMSELVTQPSLTTEGNTVLCTERREEESTTEAPKQKDGWEYIGIRKVTGYTPAPGENGGYDVTCQGIKLNTLIGTCVAINTIPLGTKIYIEGVGHRVVMDRGSGNVVDVLTKSDVEAFKTGNKNRRIWIVP